MTAQTARLLNSSLTPLICHLYQAEEGEGEEAEWREQLGGGGVTGRDVGWAASRSPPINLHITADRMVLITY